MKKLICLFIFSFLLSGLFAKDFIIRDYYYLNKNPHQIVFLTQVKNDDQYSVMIVSKNQNSVLFVFYAAHLQTPHFVSCIVMSFHTTLIAENEEQM